MDRRTKKRDKRLRESNTEPAVAKGSIATEVDEEKKRRRSSKRRLQQTSSDETDQLNVKAVNALEARNGVSVVKEDWDQFDVEGEDAEKPRKTDEVKKERKNKKNRKSSNNCENSLENGRATQPEAYQPLEDSGAFLKGKAKKSSKKKRNDSSSLDPKKSIESSDDVNENDVYQVSVGDEDTSKGMKKWIKEYYESRPGLKVLQQRIDDYITAHEARLEQEKEEREAQAAEGGWTVVVHQKGRKKTTDAESGVTVGSVAQNAVEDKISKKKRKEVGLDFYRFQRREAQRNEILMLQSKFEQDKKRIQQLRAARKFRPY
ncbi:uncharacterized protein DDB_G0283697 isoform X1 [Cucurbita moschata]|uniref:Uncharacterized protein DDB_G0283697 isoform X1 n=1 Tax=Cucurbita moschata TaxID=3662 RepID=A0A6J1FWJ5_CUCMO|nr:uncharacterized protein DDB_G0283697 isoform X1 [Cucurbita moschata]XP_022942575.1 uncharacterized protein DDB_G0283697 isoform X1 [Cucurbita moschata]